jgi:tetratricopeptide (TPR) repeat protein
MTLKKAPKILILIAALAVAFLFLRIIFFRQDPRPNVILITAHTLRPDHLSCYGYERHAAPAIDNLAGKGMMLENAYCNTPSPLYGYISILTGKITSLSLGLSVTSLAERLKTAGYTTALIASDASLLPAIKGFDTIKNISDKLPKKDIAARDRLLTREAAVILKKLRSKRKPVFAWISYALPLYPYSLPEKFEKAKDDFPYDRQILFLDDQISALMESLRKLRMSKNSIIIFTSPNGESFDEHKEPAHGMFLYNSTTRVPVIIKLPKTSVGKKIPALASHADIAPTVLDILKVRYNKDDFDGKSLVSSEEKDKAPDRALYLESLTGYESFGWSPLAGIISGGYKYIEAPEPELYDMAKDPHELKNIAPSAVKKTAEMKEKLFAFLAQRRPQLIGLLDNGPDPKSKADVLTPYLLVTRYLKDKDAAFLLKTYRQLLEKDPKNKAFRLAIAQLYLRGDRPFSAEEYLAPLTADYPEFAAGWSLLGEAYSKQGKADNAIASFEKVIALQPNSPAALNNLAWLYAQKGEYLSRALRYAQQANELVKNYPSFMDTLAEVHYRMGEKDKAKEILKKALSLDPKSEYLQKRVKDL